MAGKKRCRTRAKAKLHYSLERRSKYDGSKAIGCLSMQSISDHNLYLLLLCGYVCRALLTSAWSGPDRATERAKHGHLAT